jgi:putative tricarboxylic transport membrane protein
VRPYTIEKVTRLWPTLEEARQAWPAVLRGTGIGSMGVLPGGGALISSFAAYVVEKKVARDPSRFGQGAVEGVAGPGSANNAGAQTSFIPLLAKGIPPNPVMALMLGAITIHGIVPGTKVMTERPDLFWGMIASMWFGNLMLIGGFAARHPAGPRGGVQGGVSLSSEFRRTAGAAGGARALSPLTRSLGRRG